MYRLCVEPCCEALRCIPFLVLPNKPPLFDNPEVLISCVSYATYAIFKHKVRDVHPPKKDASIDTSATPPPPVPSNFLFWKGISCSLEEMYCKAREIREVNISKF